MARTERHLWRSPIESKEHLEDTLVAGKTAYGEDLLICRALYKGDLIPGKYIRSEDLAYISHNGEDIFIDEDYEILHGSGQDYAWVMAGSSGSIPPNSVIGGYTTSGEPLYIGRGYYKGSIIPGKVLCSHQCLYVAYDGAERSIKHFDVLVTFDPWVNLSASESELPSSSVFAGLESTGAKIFVGRALHENVYYPAKIIPEDDAAYVARGGVEFKHDSEYEVLCGSDYEWIRHVPGEPISHYAVFSGLGSQNEPLYIGRGEFLGSQTPGRIDPVKQRLYIPYGGAEHSLTKYEVLIKTSY